MNDKILFGKYMTVISDVFGKEYSELSNKIFWEVLKPYSNHECIRAFNTIIITRKSSPKPADFIEVIEGNYKDQALNAWVKLREALNNRRELDDPTINRVVDSLGGYHLLGLKTSDELVWIQKEFERTYQLIIKQTAQQKEIESTGSVRQLAGKIGKKLTG
jgi:hypothetical protein